MRKSSLLSYWPWHRGQAHVSWSKPGIGDIVAGLSMAGLLLPEAVAYASIAGLSPIHALLAGLIGLLVYALLGSSRQAIISPTSSSAAIFASAAAVSSDMGFALLIVTGGLFLLAGWLKGGFIASFISRPVMQGFAWSLAISIMLKQLPHLLGLHTTATKFFNLLWQVLQQLPHVAISSALLGVGALASWVVLKRLNRRWLPPSVVVLAVGVLLSWWLDLAHLGVKTVGYIPLSGLGLHLPKLSLDEWLRVSELAPALLLIIFAESWESVKLLATTSGDKINANQELVALGVANLLCGSSGALPVGAGYSGCNASLSAGASSKWAGVSTAIVLALLLWLGRDALALLPIPVLAAVVLGILSRHLWPTELLAGLKFGADSWLGLVCVAMVLSFGVMFGMVFSVGLSMLLAFYRFSKPLLSELGQMPDSHDFVDIKQHADAKRFDNVLIVRPEEPLFFANAERIFNDIRSLSQYQHAKNIIISMEVSRDLDATTLFELQNFIQMSQSSQQRISLARLKDTPRRAIERVPELVNEINWYWSVDDAVQAIIQQPTYAHQLSKIALNNS